MVHVSGKAVLKGVGLYVAAAVSGYLYIRSSKAPAPSPCGCGGGKHAEDKEDGDIVDGQETFDRIADCYDRCFRRCLHVMCVLAAHLAPARWDFSNTTNATCLQIVRLPGHLPAHPVAQPPTCVLPCTCLPAFPSACDLPACPQLY